MLSLRSKPLLIGVRFTHNEKNNHDWAIQLIAHRFEPPTLVEGGHFYIASYGIRIMADTDSSRTWKARHFHGTSLQRRVPVWGRDNWALSAARLPVCHWSELGYCMEEEHKSITLSLPAGDHFSHKLPLLRQPWDV